MHWWQVSLIILGVTIFVVVPCCLGAAHEQRDLRLSRPDPLDEAMRNLTGEEN